MKIYRERGEKQEKDRENKINDIRIKYDRYKRRLRTRVYSVILDYTAFNHI
jgi:hypothetical protein